MRNKQVKQVRKAVRESLQGQNLSPEQYIKVYSTLYKRAKETFKNTPRNKRNTITIS